jgi:sugar lactone lactonase YvrE
VPGGGLPGAREIDARLHADRLAGSGVRRTYQAPLAGLPSGTMVDIGGAPWLVHDGRLLAWTPDGYRQRPVEAPGGPVPVITPRAIVGVLAAGYRPVLHPSALAA